MQKIQLSYTKITAPISGIIGKSNAKVGEFVGRSPNPVILNTISLIDSIRVEFFLTEDDYLYLSKKLRTAQQEGKKTSRFPLRLILSDGSIFPYEGHVDFINREISSSTGAILIQATFPNPEGLVRPGQFARVRAIVEEVENGLLVPQRCVVEFQGTFSVLAVGEGNALESRKIEIAGPYRDYYLVSSGLKKGDRIVLEGLQKVSNGSIITPKPVQFKSQFASTEE